MARLTLAMFWPTRCAIAIPSTPVKTSVIGNRSQASVTSSGLRWYHADPSPVKIKPSARQHKPASVAAGNRTRACAASLASPYKPASTKKAFESTFAACGMPSH